MKSSKEDLELVRLYLDSQASTDDIQLLEQKMQKDNQLRKDFLAYARLDAALPYSITPTKKEKKEASLISNWPIWTSIAAILIFLFALNFKSVKSVSEGPLKKAIAHFEQLDNCCLLYTSPSPRDRG